MRVCVIYALFYFLGANPVPLSAFPHSDHKASKLGETRHFRLGLRIGLVLLLIAWILWDVIIDFSIEELSQAGSDFGQCHDSAADSAAVQSGDSVIELWFVKVFPIWRGMFSLVLALWCWGFLLWAWNKCRINYLFMLELDPRYAAGVTGTFWLASELTITLLISFLIHFKVLRCDFPRWPAGSPLGFWPLIPAVVIVYHSVFPWVERKQMWYAVYHVLMSPFVSVSFMMNFAGDVMTSLIKPFSDVAYTVCYYGSGDWLGHLGDEGLCLNKELALQRYIIPIILLGPYWLRLMQCLRRYYDTGNRVPNLPNAIKYALSMLITVFGVTNPSISQPFGWSTMQVLWTVAYMVSTLYRYVCVTMYT